jgi:hypothetical protein
LISGRDAESRLGATGVGCRCAVALFERSGVTTASSDRLAGQQLDDLCDGFGVVVIWRGGCRTPPNLPWPQSASFVSEMYWRNISACCRDIDRQVPAAAAQRLFKPCM